MDITFKHGYTTQSIQGTLVGVYLNLTKRCYSLKALEGDHKGLVIAYVGLDEKFSLNSASFKVMKSGQERVRSERQKNVHAYVVGRYQDVLWRDYSLFDSVGSEVYYNPYVCDSFIYVDSGECVGVDITQVRFSNGKILVL
jgi:hypothetical protein